MLSCCLFMAGELAGTRCCAAPQEQQPGLPRPVERQAGIAEKHPIAKKTRLATQGFQERASDKRNALGMPLVKNILSDQKAIWTSPTHLRWADGTWLLPMAALMGGLFATDRAVPPALSNDPRRLGRYVSVSNYGLYSMIGAGGGLYLWGEISHDDHKRETGFLAGEAAIDALAVTSAFKYSFARGRPDQGQALGNFFPTTELRSHPIIRQWPGP